MQLVDGRRTLQVRRHQHGRRLVLQQQRGQLAARGRLARTLQAAQHQHRHVAAQMQRRIDRTQQLDQLFIDDADHLLRGIQRQQDALTQRSVANPRHEVRSPPNS